jgi:hypothetical protein
MIWAGRIGTMLGVAMALGALAAVGALDWNESLVVACGIAGLWLANHVPWRWIAALARTIVFGVWLETTYALLDKHASFDPVSALVFGVLYAVAMAATERMTTRSSAATTRL